MVFQPFDKGAEVVFDFELYGVEIKVILNFQSDVEPNPALYAGLNDVIDTWLRTYFMTRVVDALMVVSLTTYDRRTENAPKYEKVFSPPIDGAFAEPPEGNQVALVVTHTTDQTGRSFRGRSYMPGMRAAVLTSNAWTVGILSEVLSDFLQLNADAAAAGWQHVVASRVSGGVPRASVLATPVTGYRVDSVPDTQRRRVR